MKTIIYGLSSVIALIAVIAFIINGKKSSDFLRYLMRVQHGIAGCPSYSLQKTGTGHTCRVCGRVHSKSAFILSGGV